VFRNKDTPEVALFHAQRNWTRTGQWLRRLPAIDPFERHLGLRVLR
jgi:hypothetical protein